LVGRGKKDLTALERAYAVAGSAFLPSRLVRGAGKALSWNSTEKDEKVRGKEGPKLTSYVYVGKTIGQERNKKRHIDALLARP